MIVVDARGLEPPEPFERVVEALSRLGVDEEVLLLLDREPRPLYRFLSANGYRWSVAVDDGPPPCVEVRIREGP
jgi:uncharacterized protein (DUF2249 family)